VNCFDQFNLLFFGVLASHLNQYTWHSNLQVG
jgi:hypothetical protein